MFSRSQTKSLLHFVQWLFYKQTQWICVLVNAKPPISMVKKSELTKICLFPAADKESTGIIFKAMLCKQRKPGDFMQETNMHSYKKVILIWTPLGIGYILKHAQLKNTSMSMLSSRSMLGTLDTFKSMVSLRPCSLC